MIPRERVLKALNHEKPDIVPKSTRYSPEILRIFNDEVRGGIPDKFFQYESITAGLITNEALELEEQNITSFEKYFDIEFRYVEFKPPTKKNDFSAYHGDILKEAKIDEWGIARIPGKYEGTSFPLAKVKTIAELKKFPWPDYMQEYCHYHLDGLTQKWHEKGYAVAGFLQMTIFEQAWYMRGMEDLFIDMMNNNPIAEYLLDKITEIRVAMASKYAEVDVDVLRLGDDIGAQKSMLISKELWRKWLKPRLLEVITAARNIKPDIHIFYHTDGKVDPIIPELIEIGIDILNPVQPECMDVYELYREFGKYLSFWGTIGTQTTMPFGTVGQVQEVVRERIEKMGRFGGLVLGPTHTLEPDVPWENIVTLFKTINEYKL